jgi:hypothetical protein
MVAATGVTSKRHIDGSRGTVLLQVPLGTGKRVPEVTAPNAPLLPVQVTGFNQAGEGPLNAPYRHHNTFLLFQLAGKV